MAPHPIVLGFHLCSRVGTSARHDAPTFDGGENGTTLRWRLLAGGGQDGPAAQLKRSRMATEAEALFR
jgi:hypothetical protein